MHGAICVQGQQLTWAVLGAQRHPGEHWESQGAGAAVLVEKQHKSTEAHCK